MNGITGRTLTVSLLALPAALHAADAPNLAAKPNIILADDFGFAHVGFKGCQYIWEDPHKTDVAKERERETREAGR